MSLFARTGCKEDRNWGVTVFLVGVDEEESIDLTEQLNEKEATDFYNKFKLELKGSNQFIEVLKDRGEYSDKIWLLNKSKISAVLLERAG